MNSREQAVKKRYEFRPDQAKPFQAEPNQASPVHTKPIQAKRRATIEDIKMERAAEAVAAPSGSRGNHKRR